MSLRFLADENFNRPIFSGLRRHEPAIDLASVQEVGLKSHTDPEILAFAAREGRILLSHDYKTMPGHFRDFVSKHSSPGVFLVPQTLPVAQTIDALILIWAASEAEEWANRLIYLPL
jgi:Domain of unknown function (DUF5615)